MYLLTAPVERSASIRYRRRMHSIKHPLVSLALLALVSGCGGGGGSSGARSPTIVAGNVLSASAGTASRNVLRRLWQLAVAWWNSEAFAQVPGITVAIAGSSNAGLTDRRGIFRLEGNQFGPVSLLFTGNGANASLPVTLPAGGELNLINVTLRGSDIKVDRQRIHFSGPITGTDCQANLLQVLSGEQVAFRVRLHSWTAIEDDNRRPLGCTDLFGGSNADVQGTINSQGDVLALAMTVNYNGHETVSNEPRSRCEEQYSPPWRQQPCHSPRSVYRSRPDEAPLLTPRFS
jgi:hypothetical protein